MPPIDAALDEPLVKADKNDAGEIDILQFAPAQETKRGKKADKKGKKKKSKKAKIIISIIVAIAILIAGTCSGIYFY